MLKYKLERLARECALKNNWCYGLSVFDGYWYVGTWEQLEAIGAIRNIFKNK